MKTIDLGKYKRKRFCWLPKKVYELYGDDGYLGPVVRKIWLGYVVETRLVIACPFEGRYRAYADDNPPKA
jgi:hypothetical protein